MREKSKESAESTSDTRGLVRLRLFSGCRRRRGSRADVYLALHPPCLVFRFYILVIAAQVDGSIYFPAAAPAVAHAAATALWAVSLAVPQAVASTIARRNDSEGAAWRRSPHTEARCKFDFGFCCYWCTLSPKPILNKHERDFWAGACGTRPCPRSPMTLVARGRWAARTTGHGLWS